MTQQLLQLLQAYAAHDRPGCKGVPERVEVHVIELRVADRVFVRLPQALVPEYSCGFPLVEAYQRGVGLGIQWHLASLSALSHFEAYHTAAQVYPVPCQPEQFAPA